jgi:hypothetical protein
MNTFIQHISNKFKQWNNPGMNVPLARDGEKPSVTLLFAYISFIVAVLSVVYTHIYPDKITPAIVSITFWSIALLIYRVRKIDKLKFDLDDRSFELDASDEEETKPSKEGK